MSLESARKHIKKLSTKQREDFASAADVSVSSVHRLANDLDHLPSLRILRKMESAMQESRRARK